MTDGRQLRWREPWFFALRMRNRRGWQLRGLFTVAIFVVLMVGWYLDQNYGKGLRCGFAAAVVLCVGIAVFLVLLPDLGVSEVQGNDQGLARTNYSHAFSASLWRYQDILRFSFIPPHVSGRPFSLLVLMT